MSSQQAKNLATPKKNIITRQNKKHTIHKKHNYNTTKLSLYVQVSFHILNKALGGLKMSHIAHSPVITRV